ncbi:MAG: glycosyl hydrolase family 8 [Bacteroidales bacterium]|nr:glycosyl hydrolase family 8 [Bacteroidales bacterium]
MKKYFLNIIALILGVMLCNGAFAAGGINTGKGAVPFGSNTQYNYGIMPTNLPTGGTYGGSKKAADAYNAWKTAYVEKCSVGYRVKFDDNYSTVSEGIAYGMVLSVYADDKDLFDGLWAYYKANSNGNGVMNWKINGCSGVSGSNGATDAELDVAMSLVIASEQWGGSYGATAKAFIQTVKRTEMGSDGQTLNGDAWGNTNTCRNPSYFAPGYYAEFAKVDTDNGTFWSKSAVEASDKVLIANRNATSGLVSNWCDVSGTENTCGNTDSGAQGYGADACRNPWRMTIDYLWHGSSCSAGAKDINAKLIKFVSGYENQLKGPFSNRNVSNPGSGSYVNGSYTTLALPTMTSKDAQSSLNKCYASVASLGDVDVYFNTTIRCITLFVMTGNFWAPGASGFVFPPSVSSAAVTGNKSDGYKLTLNMSKLMASGTSSGSNFTVYYNGTAQSGIISGVKSNSDKTVVLTLSAGPQPGQTVTLSYNGNGSIKSSDDAVLEAFTKIEVLNMVDGSETILDDCEDGNEFNNVGGIWFTFNDTPDQNSAAKPGTKSSITPLTGKENPLEMESTGYDGSGYAVHATYKLGSNYTPYNGNVAASWTNPAYVGIGTWVDDVETSSMDWSTGTGVTFWYKGPKCMFQVIISEVTDYCFHKFDVPACASWQKITVKWGDLAQPTWGTPVAFSAKHVLKLQWQFSTDYESAGTSGDIWIDEVHILGMPPVALTGLEISPVSDADLADDDCAANIDPLKIPIASKAIGDTLYLETTATPEDASYPVVFWSSSDEDVVTVDYKGRVIGVGYGEATITARSKMHQNIFTTYTVKVPAPAVKPTAIAFEESSYEVTVGETATIIPTFSPVGVTETGLTWTSSDQTKATVSSSGVVTGIAPGNVTITATSTAVSSVKKTVTVTVKDVSVTDVTVDESEVALELGDSKVVTATVAPASVSQDVLVSSSDEDVATVSATGNTITISSVGVGSATITVKSKADETITTTIAVTVTGVSVTDVTISGTETTVQVGKTISLTAAVAPAAAAQTVTWTSSNDEIATVTGGVVTGVAMGKATIKAASTEDATKFDEYEVTVTAVPVATITITPATKTLSVGEETELAVSVKPDNAGDKTVTWSSSDETIATVDATGTVTAVKAGSCTISATANDGSAVVGECALTVEAVLPTSITMATELGFTLGDDAQTLIPTIAPANATDKTVTWKSSDETVATVVDGVVTPVGVGECTITATSVAAGTVKAECSVSVVASTVAVEGVTLDATATVYFGKTTTLAAAVSPANATNKSVTWKSSDETVATVDANGVVTGVKVGTATITVTTVDGSKTATCEVTVEHIAIETITLSEKTLSLSMESAPVQLEATFTPAEATDNKITWTSSDSKVVTVVNGIVTPVAVGTANVTATNSDGSVSDVCVVTVSAVPVTAVTLDKTTAEISVGGSVALTATVAPENASDKSVAWSSSDETVATVTNGIVSGVAAGTATITVTTNDGAKTATCEVTVKANTIAVTGVTISPAGTKSIALNEALTFTATVAPTNATVKDVVWSSSDESVATVTDGALTVKKVGTTTITVTTVDGDFTASCDVTVTDILTTNIIIDNSLSLTVGESASIKATILPAGASTTVDWKSDKPAVATVDATGKVTAVSAGTANITATTTDGTDLTSDKCVVTVSNVSVESVTLNNTSAIVRLGGSSTLKATVTPANATIKDVVWTSSKPAVATVDESGKVTAVAAGSAIITAASAEDAYTKATCTIDVVDDAALSAELALANSTYASAKEGTNIGEYKAGSKTTFKSAIDAAQLVMDNVSATQSDIDDAVATLKAAEKTFAKAINANETLIFNADMAQENMTYMATYWFSFDDNTASDDPKKCGSSVITPKSTEEEPFTMAEPGYNGTGKAAMMQYTLEGSKALGYSPFVGMGMNFADPAGVAFDMTGSTGISFWMKNDSPVYFEVELTTISDACDFYIYLPASSTWQPVELSWADLEQYTWGKQVTWDLAELTKCQWKVQEADGETGKVWVDEVKVLGVALDLPEIVDYEALYTAIAEAQAAVENAVVGTLDGNYPQSAVTALEKATTTAEASLKAKTQAEVDNAVTALNKAIADFAKAVIGVDRSTLQTYIAQAEGYYASAEEGYEEGMYLIGSKDILLDAIDAAKDVDATAAVSQKTVDNAAATLKKAIDTFLDSKFDPSSINRNALESALADANKAIGSAVEGMGNGQYKVGAIATLQDAIDAAQTAYDKSSASQAEIDNATTTLRAAMEAFEKAKVTVNKSSLTFAITNANTLYNGAVEGIEKGNYPVGSKATLMTAITTAQAVESNASASQTEVDAAKAALTKAVDAFKASMITVDKSQLIYQINLANAALAKAEGNTGDGSGQYPAYAVSSFTNAINYANEIYANSTDQTTVNGEVSVLIAAIANFERSKNAIVEVVDITELAKLISEADSLLDNTRNPSVNFLVYIELCTRKSNAKSEYEKETHVQSNVNTQARLLAEAIEAFKKAFAGATGIEDAEEVALAIYPNPCVNEVVFTAGKEIKTIAIVSLAGATQFVANVEATEATLEVSNLKAGVYFAKIQYADNTVETKQFMKR